jgi:hypothetical protein
VGKAFESKYIESNVLVLGLFLLCTDDLMVSKLLYVGNASPLGYVARRSLVNVVRGVSWLKEKRDGEQARMGNNEYRPSKKKSHRTLYKHRTFGGWQTRTHARIFRCTAS